MPSGIALFVPSVLLSFWLTCSFGVFDSQAAGHPLVIVEGFLILENPGLLALIDLAIILKVSKDELLRRRKERSEDPACYVGMQPARANWLDLYFEDAIWPSAVMYLQRWIPQDPNSNGVLQQTTTPGVWIVVREVPFEELLQEVLALLQPRLNS